MFELIKKWYKTEGTPWFHNPAMLEKAVEKGWITEEQKEEIMNSEEE